MHLFDMGKLGRKEREEKTTLKTVCLELISCRYSNIYIILLACLKGRKGKSSTGTRDLKTTQSDPELSLFAVHVKLHFFKLQVISNSIWNADGGNLEEQPDRTCPQFEDCLHART